MNLKSIIHEFDLYCFETMSSPTKDEVINFLSDLHHRSLPLTVDDHRRQKWIELFKFCSHDHIDNSLTTWVIPSRITAKFIGFVIDDYINTGARVCGSDCANNKKIVLTPEWEVYDFYEDRVKFLLTDKSNYCYNCEIRLFIIMHSEYDD